MVGGGCICFRIANLGWLVVQSLGLPWWDGINGDFGSFCLVGFHGHGVDG